MKGSFFIIILLFSNIVIAGDPVFAGVYLSGFQNNILENKDFLGYPSNRASFAGKLVLSANKTDSVNYITQKKASFINQASKESKEFAIRNKKSFYTVVGLSFQIIRTENTTEIYADYYIAAW